MDAKKTIRAGLITAANIAGDSDLRQRAGLLSELFIDVQAEPELRISAIDAAERNLTRLTAAYAPALTIIRLLKEMLGVALECGGGQTTPMPGFLFDMNIFFQRLLSRFLHENLVSLDVADEQKLRKVIVYSADGNPRSRRAPGPKPDFALFHCSALVGYVDAKYRDIWERGFPADWLYQLAIYALGSPFRTSILLYATVNPGSRDERLEVRAPASLAEQPPAFIVLRPVVLSTLDQLLDPSRTRHLTPDRRRFAMELCRFPPDH